MEPPIARQLVDDIVAYLPQWLEYRRQSMRFPGMQVAIYVEDRIVMSVALGEADVERTIPLRKDHLLRVASHSKWLTATAVMQLIESGQLGLDHLASEYVPWLTPTRFPGLGDVSIEHLLSHGSGIPGSGEDSDWDQLYGRPTAEQLPTYLENQRLNLNQPGKGFVYSNFGYAILGEIIAAVTGKSYNAYVTKNIVERLRLEHTGPDYHPAITENFARGYGRFDPDHSSRYPVILEQTNSFAPVGGWYSTAEEMCRFAAAFFPGNERLLSDRSKRDMERERWTNIYPPFRGVTHLSYGLGIAAAHSGDQSFFGHGGTTAGFFSAVLFEPQNRIAVATLINAIDWNTPVTSLEITTAILKLFRHTNSSGQASIPQRAPASLRSARRFEWLWGVVDLVSLNDCLYMVDPDNPDLIAGIAPVILEGEGVNVRLYFTPNGEVEKIRIRGASAFPPERYRELFLVDGVWQPPEHFRLKSD
jgi:CubicO group peptidase (beta-lactamase class C family)